MITPSFLKVVSLELDHMTNLEPVVTSLQQVAKQNLTKQISLPKFSDRQTPLQDYLIEQKGLKLIVNDKKGVYRAPNPRSLSPIKK